MVHHLGLSSHTPLLANRVLDMQLIEVLMFSINPVYDYGKGDFGFGENTERYDTLPPLSARRRRHLGHEALLRRPAAG